MRPISFSSKSLAPSRQLHMLGHKADHHLTDIVSDTISRVLRLPEMTFIVVKTWEMVNVSLTSDSQVSPGLTKCTESDGVKQFCRNIAVTQYGHGRRDSMVMSG